MCQVVKVQVGKRKIGTSNKQQSGEEKKNCNLVILNQRFELILDILQIHLAKDDGSVDSPKHCEEQTFKPDTMEWQTFTMI